MDSKFVEVAPTQVARRQMVRPMVKYDNIELTPQQQPETRCVDKKANVVEINM